MRNIIRRLLLAFATTLLALVGVTVGTITAANSRYTYAWEMPADATFAVITTTSPFGKQGYQTLFATGGR